MNRIEKLFQEDRKLLSIYCTAGYPNLEDTLPILQTLETNGVDLIEIGLPFSDPLADGSTIQESASQAIQNGMTTKVLFEQLEDVRKKVQIPLIMMGYFNPILQFGVESFCEQCAKVGIDGLIIPDLPVEVYIKEYKSLFEKYGLLNILLITPQTSKERIQFMDKHTQGFLYMVSSASTTGNQQEFGENQIDYFKRIHDMELKHPKLVGFGIHNHSTYHQATTYAEGAIIGSAFIKFLKDNPISNIHTFTNAIR